MAFSSDFLRELEARSPIEEIAPSYVQLKRSGRNLMGLCPFHNEKTPSFVVYPESNSFYCFGCHKGGGIFQFIMEAERLAFPDAVRWLAQRAGMTVPEDGADDGMSRLRTRILEINREAGRFYFGVLSTPAGAAGYRYLRERGLSNRTIQRFGLGFAPESGYALVDHLRAKGYAPEEITAADMARTSQRGRLYDRYRGRVMFPIFDLRGNVVAFGGRVLGDEKPKYINTADTPVYHKSSGLFAMNLAKEEAARSRALILAEGYMDVIALHQAGFSNAIASLGTALTEEQARVIRRYAEEAVLCYDADEAGQRATQRAIPILKGAGLRVRVVTVPGGKDPDGYIRSQGENGPLRFRQLLEAGGNDTEYALAKLKARFDLDTEDGKARYLREAVNTVLAGLDGLERDIYAGKLAGETGVNRESILETARQAALQRQRREKRDFDRSLAQVEALESSVNPDKKGNPRAAQAEEGILAYLFAHPEASREMAAALPPEKFVTRWNRRVYELLLGKTMAEPAPRGPMSLADFAQELSGGELAELTRVVNRRREAPVSPGDVQAFREILLEEAGQASAQEIREASPEQLRAYLEALRKRK